MTMSHENVDIVHRLMEAWQRHDYATALSFYAEDAVFEPWEGYALGEQRFTGRRRVAEGFAEWFETFDDYWSTVDALIDAGDQVVQLSREGGRGRISGVPVAGETALVYTFRDGEIVLVRGYRDHTAARAAAGLAE